MKREDAKKLISTAVAGLLAAGVLTQTASAADDKGKQEKCFGVAQAGKNDCATSKHSCAGMATSNNSPEEFKNVPVGTCEKIGGSLKPKAS
ncbi:MAG: DUF2282 domain-containing protein [Nevskiaceae bacterium]|nr:MAG: DUF2282 domain-containing protein [Nevskiaceae bacterium]